MIGEQLDLVLQELSRKGRGIADKDHLAAIGRPREGGNWWNCGSTYQLERLERTCSSRPRKAVVIRRINPTTLSATGPETRAPAKRRVPANRQTRSGGRVRRCTGDGSRLRARTTRPGANRRITNAGSRDNANRNRLSTHAANGDTTG
jgi:hypothetical protein